MKTVKSCDTIQDMKNLVSVPEFAKRLCISRAWVFKLVRGGVLKTVRLGHYYYMTESEAVKWHEKFKAHGKFSTFPRMTRHGLVMRKPKGVESPTKKE